MDLRRWRCELPFYMLMNKLMENRVCLYSFNSKSTVQSSREAEILLWTQFFANLDIDFMVKFQGDRRRIFELTLN